MREEIRAEFYGQFNKSLEANKQELFKEVDYKAQDVIERLKEQQSQVENELQLIETSIEKTEIFLKRSTNSEIVKM